MLRRFLRATLAFLTRKTIKKHKPLIILVEGEDSPTIIRQAIYTILSEKYNTRQNLEQTHSEFSIPLTVIGRLFYPENTVEWIKIIFKTSLQLIYLKPYDHALVINLHFINREIFDLWFSVLSPQIVVTTGQSFIKQSGNPKFTHIQIEKSEVGKILKGEITVSLKKIAEKAGITSELPKDLLIDNAPQPAIRILPSRENSIIIDARHFYYPPNLKTVIEMAEAIPGKKFIFTKIGSDLKELPQNFEVLKSVNDFKITPGSTYIFRGEKDEYISEIETLSIDGFDK